MSLTAGGYSALVQRWDLTAIDAPDGTRDPVVLAEDGTTRAVLVKLNPGQELGEHEVKEHAWIAVVEGRVRVSADGDAVDAGPGTLFRFDREERHAVSSDDGARILVLLAPFPGPGHYRGGGAETPGG